MCLYIVHCPSGINTFKINSTSTQIQDTPHHRNVDEYHAGAEVWYSSCENRRHPIHSFKTRKYVLQNVHITLKAIFLRPKWNKLTKPSIDLPHTYWADSVS
jgi:hypothetical protein